MKKPLFRHNGFVAVHQKVSKHGYVVYKGYYTPLKLGGQRVPGSIALSPSGEYIGPPAVAHRLCATLGIAPVALPGRCVCTIGYSHRMKAWFGWSHRALCGFSIGSVCSKGHCHYRPRSEGGRGHWVAKTMMDAKRMAIDFAEGVS